MGQTKGWAESQVDRLQKVMAQAGVASRRACEELIASGRVRVNGQVVSEQGCKVDPNTDSIEVDGKALRLHPPAEYIMLYKPAGYVTTSRDPEGRPTVLDLVQSTERIFAVGRLDFNSEGLVLLTNDGSLAQRLTHPSYEHEKEYHVLVQGRPEPETLQRLSAGIELEDGRTWPARISLLKTAGPNAWLRWVMHEGRNRQIRRMCDQVGHSSLRIIRIRVGTLKLESLRPGQWRTLTPSEVNQLHKPAAAVPARHPAVQHSPTGRRQPAASSLAHTDKSEV
jgi:23S rRNA pseudouridine2605 synthase